MMFLHLVYHHFPLKSYIKNQSILYFSQEKNGYHHCRPQTFTQRPSWHPNTQRSPLRPQRWVCCDWVPGQDIQPSGDVDIQPMVIRWIPSGNLTQLLIMAIEIVDFPIKNGPFSIAMIVYQRVSQTEEFFWGG